MLIQPANPSYGNGQVASVTTASGNVTLAAPSKQVLFTNLGANPAFVCMSPTARAATTADACIPPGAMVTYTKFYDQLVISMISTGGATSVHVIPAEGF
jgi:hypothetical protein